MRASSSDSHLVQTSNKRGVTFDTVETLERNSNCIDKLALLVRAMKMTIKTRNSLPINQRFTKVDLEIKIETDRILHLEIDPLVEAEVKVEIEEIITIETIIDPITEIDQEVDGTIIGTTITRLTIDEVIIDEITDQTLNRHLETEVKVEIELEITTMTIQEVEVEIEIMIDLFSQDKAHYLMEEMNLCADPTLG